jgi:putative sigma-54 modulation protein
MEMKITGKNLDLAQGTREYINKKLNKVGKHLNNMLSFEVVATEEKTKDPNFRYIIQVTINNNGTIIRGEERASELKAAVDKVSEVITRQVEHYKGKKPYSKKRQTPSIRTIGTEDQLESESQGALETDTSIPRIVKNKSFVVKPMPLDEAVDQMELLGHDFYLFLNEDGSVVNLLYRRRDGDYGLIEATAKS